MRETEITVQVFNDLGQIKQILDKNGFKLKSEYTLKDYYISKHSSSELLKMEYKAILNSSMLLREIPEDNEKVLIFKDKSIDKNGNVISEQKIRCKIENAQNALQIFNKAGLTCWNNLQQHISVYSNGEVEFAVQVVKDLGVFIEYEEDQSIRHLTEHEKIKIMTNRLNALGFNLGTDYSCKKVYMKFLNENKNQGKQA